MTFYLILHSLPEENNMGKPVHHFSSRMWQACCCAENVIMLLQLCSICQRQFTSTSKKKQKNTHTHTKHATSQSTHTHKTQRKKKKNQKPKTVSCFLASDETRKKWESQQSVSIPQYLVKHKLQVITVSSLTVLNRYSFHHLFTSCQKT